ncbi:glycosyltransferase [Thiorhodovibrio frisius]|uniref:Glycosyltransferase n=1 Tax=Thiorhodovibrio frisius TaxID=631362 RepID=H8Z1J0_9GAMM|nr:glycosyltransferase [Thiorhodovibrio frisius]EIC22539.1 glycosyltransferase [Thiorhodovibrio frisius]WPL19978.1 Putative glycosyltransferase EpsF [Thiorhodovibrio frisius]
MNQLHCITGLSTGGAEMALYRLLQGGLAHHQTAAVVSLTDDGTFGPRIRALGFNVYALRSRPDLSFPIAIAKFARIGRLFSPDLIQGWMYHGNLAACFAAMIARRPPVVVWNVRQSLYDLAAEKPTTRYVIQANRWLSSRPKAVLYNSTLSRGQHERLGFASARGMVIPNGFDLAAFAPDARRRRATRGAAGASDADIVIGHVARLHPMKDHACFLRSAVQLLNQRHDLLYVMIGRNVFPDHPALSGIIPPPLLRYFVFLGERADVADWMQGMDMFCQSSSSEAFPNVLAEAMASGLPCVATDVGDSADIIGKAGILVRPKDSHALALGIQAMLQKSAMERQAMGRAARLRIATHFGLNAVVERYRGLYQDLVSSR